MNSPADLSEVRGGGLLKFARLLSQGWTVRPGIDLDLLRRHMVARFCADFPPSRERFAMPAPANQLFEYVACHLPDPDDPAPRAAFFKSVQEVVLEAKCPGAEELTAALEAAKPRMYDPLLSPGAEQGPSFEAALVPAVRARSGAALGEAARWRSGSSDAPESTAVCAVDWLPTELLEVIFSLCDSKTLLLVAPAVCSRWRQVTSAGGIAARLDLSFLAGYSQLLGCTGVADLDSWLQATTRRFSGAVALGGCRGLTDAQLSMAAEHCPNLTELDLRWCHRVSGAGIAEVARRCRNLAALDLGWCQHITDAAVAAVAEQTPNLTKLSLQLCEHVSDVGIKKLAADCPKLCELDLGGYITPYNICPHVGIIGNSRNAAGHRRFYWHDLVLSVTDASLEALGTGCANLRKLSLEDCGYITDTGLAKLAVGCPKLTTLNLSCFSETDREAGIVLPAIYIQNQARVTDAGIAKLAAECSDLVDLSLGGRMLITDVGLCDLAAGCRKLTTLSLFKCQGVTDVGLKNLAGCWDLNKLSLYGCERVTDAGLEQLAAGCPKLAELDLRQPHVTRRITRVGLEKLAEGCWDLLQISLDESWSDQDMDAVREQLAAKQPNLVLHRAESTYWYHEKGTSLSDLVARATCAL